MKNIDFEEMRSLQLGILAAVSAFCDEHCIRYHLSSGTALGAVRHKGYIPWDDDIDIDIPRPDYNRFIREFSHENYSVLCWDNNRSVLMTYVKVSDNRTRLEENINIGVNYGINIDVFPVDGLPENEKRLKKHIKKENFLWRIVECITIKDSSKRSFKKRIGIGFIKAFFAVIPLKSFIVGCAIKHAQKYDFDKSAKVAMSVWGDGFHTIIPHDTEITYKKISFEGMKFNIPVNYDEYLSGLYGDYMKLPPENQRVRPHNMKAYWL